MKYLLLLSAVFFAAVTHAQHSLALSIKNAADNTALAGATATIASLKKTTVADSLGTAVFTNLAAGQYQVSVSYAGYANKTITALVPQPDSTAIEVALEEAADEDEEAVVVRATRISRSIANMPTRVEIISGEELVEKGNMKPGDIRMLLNESTGIQTQQTSATSFNAGIRIQGLEGRYTQLLRDGYPLYAGFAGGLSILQIAPLDLQQVEVVKGAASTLYGGGAIAGLVNLVSKTPGNKREINFLANGTTAGGLDLSGFYSQRLGKAGLTFFASRNSNKPFDPAGIGLTAIPKFSRYTVNPRLFLYGKKTKADFGVTYTTESRTGGSTAYIKNMSGAGFFEQNNTTRITTQLGVTHQLSEATTLQAKYSYNWFDRAITIPAYGFDALQQSSFTELSWNKTSVKIAWVVGANILTDELNEKTNSTNPKRDYRYNTYGLFVQNAWTVTQKFVLETGLRADHVSQFGFEVLPRLSAMLRLTPRLTTRIGGGFGYKTPTIFTEDAERIQFQNILPVDVTVTKNERSVGGNWDINYNTKFGAVGFSINHLFFYTRLNRPMVLINSSSGYLQFKNADGYLDTRGTETNLRITYSNFKLFVGYTYTDAATQFNYSRQRLPLTARHRLNNVLMYEVEDKLKIGLEGYYFSKQKLNDGSFGQSYWITGLMAEKLWGHFSLFVNFENFTDTRQSKFDAIYSGTINNPVFRDIYAPVEGFVVNGGVKIRL